MAARDLGGLRRPFRFIAQAKRTFDPRVLTEEAREAEARGFDVLVVSDHLVRQLAPLSALAHIAASTEKLRLGTLVLNNDLRHPAVLAQELASLDILSRGRLEIGLGAGWNRAEYAATGIEFSAPGVRIDRLEEAIEILDGAFAEGPFSFRGEHYRIDSLDGQPKPVQRPRPPLLVAGGGRRILGLAARVADIVGLAPMPPHPAADAPFDVSPEAVGKQMAWIRESASDRFDQLEINIHPALGPVALTNHPRAVAATMVAGLDDRFGLLDVDDILASPFSLIGSVPEIVDKVIGLRERFGISSIHVRSIDDLAPVVERLTGA